MLGMVELLFGWLASLLKSRRRLHVENLVLRHQIIILRQQSPRRTRLSNPDRLVLVWLYRLCPTVVDAVAIIRPETLAASAAAAPAIRPCLSDQKTISHQHKAPERPGVIV